MTGFGFVTFEDESSVDQAVAKHYHIIKDKRVRNSSSYMYRNMNYSTFTSHTNANNCSPTDINMHTTQCTSFRESSEIFLKRFYTIKLNLYLRLKFRNQNYKSNSRQNLEWNIGKVLLFFFLFFLLLGIKGKECIPTRFCA